MITEICPTAVVVQVDREKPHTLPKNSEVLAPYRTHTAFTIQCVLTSEAKSKLNREFQQLPNLGNT